MKELIRSRVFLPKYVIHNVQNHNAYMLGKHDFLDYDSTILRVLSMLLQSYMFFSYNHMMVCMLLFLP